MQMQEGFIGLGGKNDQKFVGAKTLNIVFHITSFYLLKYSYCTTGFY